MTKRKGEKELKNDHISEEIQKNCDPGRKEGEGNEKQESYGEGLGQDFESHQESPQYNKG